MNEEGDLQPKSLILSKARLSSFRITRKHFLEWDPKVFLPGQIWNSVSFPPNLEIEDNSIYLFVAVLFYVDKKLRETESRVWDELIRAWDRKFGLAPGERPTWNGQRYGSLLLGGFSDDEGYTLSVPSMVNASKQVKVKIWPGISLDLAISGESESLSAEEGRWLKDCLEYYRPPINSLEMLHDVRDSMLTEGPRWWKEPDSETVVWMPKEFWGQSDD